MNIRLFKGVIAHKYVIIRFGWFRFGHWLNRNNSYKEYRIGLFLIKIEDWE